MKKKRPYRRKIQEIVIPPLPESVRQLIDRKFSETDDDTPDNVMRNALLKIYGVNIDDERSYGEFISYLTKGLSKLSTGGRSDDMFEPDFDSFFTLMVRAINECGEMLELLEKNGIEYRPKWMNENGENEDI